MARPTKYTDELVDEICRRLPLESLLQICKDEEMPCRDTIYTWLLDEKYTRFSDNYGKAMNLRYDNMADEVLEIADDDSGDMLVSKDGEKGNPTRVARDKLRSDNRKWVLSKMQPKKYGDRINQHHSGDVTVSAADELIKALGKGCGKDG
jgi:hypothetical protein